MNNKISKLILESIAVLLSFLILVPLYMIVIGSFKDKAGASNMNFALPLKWHIFSNYSEMIKNGGVLIGLKNSFFVTILCVTLLVFICSMSAFVLQRRKTGFSNTLYNLIVLGLIIPLQIIPAYFICYYLNISSYMAAIIMLAVTNYSFGTFLYTGFFKSIPRDIDESAILDGVGSFRLFFNIIFPLIKPVTVTLIIISFMSVWNDFGTTIYFLNSPSNFTVTLTVFNFLGTYSSDWNLIFANVVIVSLPVVVLYLVLQKYIIDGMTAGSVKG